ncbi:hypothetical protein [Gordonia iterans]
MDTLVTIVFILIIGGALASFFIARNRQAGRVSGAAGYENGVLTVTGVSDVGAADKNGQSYVSVSGTIIGGSTAPTEVYGTLVLDVGLDKPYVGEEKAVVYKPGKVESTWRFGTLDV